jgi:ketosteroid isomerase-like protein
MIIGLVLMLALAQAAPAADPEKGPFLGLETRLSKAIQAKDVPALDALLAKDFAFSVFFENQAPEVLNRNEWLNTSKHYTLTGFEIQFLAARVFGDVAVVRYQPRQSAALGTGIERSGEFAVVDVWTKQGGDWKLSSRHLSRPDKLRR